MIDDTLGLVSDADLDLIIESAKEKDRKKLMESISNAFKSGLTAGNIAESLITRLRDRITYSSDEKAYDIALYNDMIDKLRQSIIEMQGSGIPEIILETSLFKFVSSPLTAFKGGHWLYIIFPILVCAATYFSFKLNTTASMNSEQEKQMKMMMNISIVFITIASFTMSTGIELYWIFNSGFTVIQNLLVKRSKKNANII